MIKVLAVGIVFIIIYGFLSAFKKKQAINISNIVTVNVKFPDGTIFTKNVKRSIFKNKKTLNLQFLYDGKIKREIAVDIAKLDLATINSSIDITVFDEKTEERKRSKSQLAEKKRRNDELYNVYPPQEKRREEKKNEEVKREQTASQLTSGTFNLEDR